MIILTQNWLITVLAVTVIHWILPAKIRGGWIVLASALFLYYYSPISLGILSVLTAVYYFAAVKKDTISGRSLISLILFTASILGGYKFYDGVLLSPTVDLTPDNMEFIIPLGLSYYAFRVIHYAIEKYKGTIPAHSFSEFAQFMFFLPTFLAGPIHRFHDFQKDLNRKRWDSFMMAQGVERILYGYVKITFIANLLVTALFGEWLVHAAAGNEHLYAYLDMIKAFLSLYFLFSGFSDIAIGFGMMLGFKVMENFNFPFLAANISDFWRRWHISLTSWCRDYVYMGVMSTARNAALAAAAAMLVMGLWHEFSIRFIVWGFYHGIGIIIWQNFQHIKPKLPQVKNKYGLMALRVLSTALTLHYFMFGMLIANNPDLSTTWGEWHKMLFFWL